MAQATFVQKGDAIDYTPVSDVTAGDVIVQGDLIGVANREIKADTLGALALEGVFDVAKESGGGVTFSMGDLAYWDDANDVAVTTDDGGANKLLGKVVADAADADTTVRVRLCPCAVVTESSPSSSGS